MEPAHVHSAFSPLGLLSYSRAVNAGQLGLQDGWNVKISGLGATFSYDLHAEASLVKIWMEE